MKVNQLLAEFLGTCALLIVVVGSGIMAESLAQGNEALALLANSLATGAGLFALIQTFASISGAHFNPAVSLVEFLRSKLSVQDFLSFTAVQIAGALLGVILSHIMFGQALLQVSNHSRSETRLFFSEGIATLGLILVVVLSGRKNPEKTPAAVALFITAAYWCTSSTSFANPAVTIARAFTNSFSGILLTSVPGFIVAQTFGALVGYGISKKLLKTA